MSADLQLGVALEAETLRAADNGGLRDPDVLREIRDRHEDNLLAVFQYIVRDPALHGGQGRVGLADG